MIIDVTIPKGTLVRTTHPNGKTISKRVQVVKCDVSMFDTEIRWAGTGSYWRWVKISDIIDANPKLREYFGD